MRRDASSTLRIACPTERMRLEASQGKVAEPSRLCADGDVGAPRMRDVPTTDCEKLVALSRMLPLLYPPRMLVKGAVGGLSYRHGLKARIILETTV